MAAGAEDDDEPLSIADIIDQALEAIAATDEAPSPDEEGEGEGAEAGSDAARGAAGGRKSWGQWERFGKRVAQGKAYASCAIDFAFTDGGRLSGSSAQLERMYCFHDPATTDDTRMLDVVHAHTTALWKDRRSLAGRGRALRSITSVNARYGRRSDPAAGFQQDRSKLFLVPKSAVLLQQWRSLPESDLVWDLDDDSVPPLDAEFAARYESVRQVLRAGEAFCQDAELAFSYSESNARMRGTTTRDGQEVEYEVVACTRKARKDLRVAVDADPAAWQNLRAAVLCIGLGEYKHLPVLPNATRDARALCEKVNALPHCRALLLADLPDRRALQKGIRTFLKEPGLQKMPPETVLINYSGHGTQRGGTVYMLPGDADLDDATCEPDVDFLPIRDIFKWCREDLDAVARDLSPPREVAFVLVADACRVAEMDLSTLSSSLEPPPASAPKKWALCSSCSRDSTASDGPSGSHSPFAQELLDEDAGIFAVGVPLKGGLEAACRRVSAQHQGQTPMPVGLHNINEDWCLCPAPSEGPSPAPSPDAAAGTAIHCAAVSGSSSAAFLRVLDINNQEDCAHLWAEGIKTTEDLMELELEDITAMAQALSLSTKKRLTRFAQLSREEKQRVLDGSSAAAASAAAAPPPPSPQAKAEAETKRKEEAAAKQKAAAEAKTKAEAEAKRKEGEAAQEKAAAEAKEKHRVFDGSSAAAASAAAEEREASPRTVHGEMPAPSARAMSVAQIKAQLRSRGVPDRDIDCIIDTCTDRRELEDLLNAPLPHAVQSAEAENAGAPRSGPAAGAASPENREPDNSYCGDGKRLVFDDVKFKSKGTVLGSSKDRIGTLTIQHGQVQVQRYDGAQSILVYQFGAMTGTLSGSTPTSSCITIHPAVNSNDKARTFTFRSQEDRTQFEEAFQATKAWIQLPDAFLRTLPTQEQRGAASVIVEGMRFHAADPGVQEEACRALGSLAVKSAENKTLIARVGGIEALVTAMQGHATDPGVQEQACRALRELAFKSAENKTLIARLGGIEAILKAMKDHPTHPEVQKQACGALYNLAVNPENQVKLPNLGGIEALLKGMKDHPAHPGVQAQACGALKNLAANPENKVKIPNLGGIEALLTAMKDHPGIAEVQEQACLALFNISLKAENNVKISNLGASEPIRRAMAAANATDDTKKWGQQLLDKLAQC